MKSKQKDDFFILRETTINFVRLQNNLGCDDNGNEGALVNLFGMGDLAKLSNMERLGINCRRTQFSDHPNILNFYSFWNHYIKRGSVKVHA